MAQPVQIERFKCLCCAVTFPDTVHGHKLERSHLDTAHSLIPLQDINANRRAGQREWCRCAHCHRHFSTWGSACVHHAQKCIKNVDAALAGEYRYSHFFPVGNFNNADLANQFVIERPFAIIQPMIAPQVGQNGNLLPEEQLPVPPAPIIAPILLANPHLGLPHADAEVLVGNVIANPAQHVPNPQPRRLGRAAGGARRLPGNPNQAAPVVNAANPAAIPAIPVQGMHGFNFTFVGDPSAEQLIELDYIASELSEGCYWMHPTHVRSFRLVTDTLLRIHLDPTGDACLKKLAIYALLTLCEIAEGENGTLSRCHARME